MLGICRDDGVVIPRHDVGPVVGGLDPDGSKHCAVKPLRSRPVGRTNRDVGEHGPDCTRPAARRRPGDPDLASGRMVAALHGAVRHHPPGARRHGG